MSREFNYIRAWHERALPAIKAFGATQLEVLRNVLPQLADLSQTKDAHLTLPLSDAVRKELGRIPIDQLAPMAEAMHDFGHWMPGSTKYRRHTCHGCNHEWEAQVKYPTETQRTTNLSGEMSVYCPKCDHKSSVATPHYCKPPEGIPTWFYAGCGWRFSNVADQVLREAMADRTPSIHIHEGVLRITSRDRDNWIWEEVGYATPENLAKIKKSGLGWGLNSMEKNAKKLRVLLNYTTGSENFMDHKPGTKFDDEERVQLIGKFEDITPHRISNQPTGPTNATDRRGCRMEPHPFVIGQEHFPKNGGMYINPDQAGCYECDRPHAQHTSEQVLLITIEGDRPPNAEELKRFLAHIEHKNAQEPDANIKIAGFGILKAEQV